MFFHFLSFSFIFFYFLSFYFIFFFFLSLFLLFLFIFFHVLSRSFIFLPFFFHFFSFLSVFFQFSFMFFHVLSLFFPLFFLLVLLLYSGAQNPFLPRLPHDFLSKLLSKKSTFWAVSGVPHRALFFSLVYFFIFFSFSFSFSISFHVFYFSFVFLFFMFPLFSFCSPLKNVSSFFQCVSLFSFLRCSKSVAALQDSFGKSSHSELALFALYWLVVTFLCGIEHILVMIRLRVVYGGRRVGQVLPSYQNRQTSALDETADAPQSSLFSLLSSSQIYKYLSLFSRKLVLAGRSRVAPGRLP